MTFLEYIQDMSYQTRVKIFWAAFVLVALGLTFLILQSIRNTISNAEGNIVAIQTSSRQADETETPFVSVERVEKPGKDLKIYFNIYNPTNDILNLPELSNIKLAFGNTTVSPQKITNRQGEPFVQKVLSNTRVFGTLTFGQNGIEKGTLTFNQMYFEKTPSDVFQQRMHLDIEALSKNSNVRN